MLVLGLVFGAFFRVESYQGWAKEKKEGPFINQKPNQLELSLVADTHIYKRDDYLRLHAMLINTDYASDIFVYGTLGWGYSASLTFTLRDSSGREIHPQIFPDDFDATNISR